MGPFPMNQLLAQGLTLESNVWCEGMADWALAKDVPELRDLFAPQSPSSPQPSGGPDLSKPQDSHAPQQPQQPQRNPQPHTQYNAPYGQGAPNNANMQPPAIDVNTVERKFKTFAVCFWAQVAWVVLSFIGIAVLAGVFRMRDDEVGLAVLLASLVWIGLIIAYLVNGLYIVNQCWAIIQDGGRARTKPGEAVGLLFVPLFTYYWRFVAYKGLAEDMNNYQIMRNFNYRKIDTGIASAYPVLRLCSIVPYLGFLSHLAALVIYFVMIINFKNALIHFIREKQGGF